jgi:hypothetical protein
LCPKFQLRAIPFSLQRFSSSSSREASENYQFHHRMIHRGENCKDPAYCGSRACVCGRYVQCFGPKNWVQFLRIDVQYSVFFFFLNGFAINFFFLGVFVAASFLDLTPVLIGMVRCSRSSSILCLLRLFFLRWNI